MAKDKQGALLESDIEGYIMKAWNSGVRFSLKEVYAKLKRRLTETPDVNMKDPACKRHCIILVGNAGEGKTSIPEQLCEDIGAEFQTYHHGATIVEDNHGLQQIDEKNGMTRHVLAAHMVPFLREPKSGRGIFLIDEALNGAFNEHQVVLRMLVDGQCDEHKVKPGWLFVCATNPPVAKYSTVQQSDFSLEDRFVVLPVEVAAEDKLEYWSTHMPTTVYKFLLLHHINKKEVDYVSAISSRRWSTMAYDVEKDIKAGATPGEVMKVLQANISTACAASFAAFLENGDNPDKYPMRVDEILKATKEEMKAIKARLTKWITATPPAVPLLGATKCEINWMLKDEERRTKLKKEELDNLAEVFIHIGSKGYADMVDDMFHQIIQTDTAQELLHRAQGSELEKRLVELYKQQTAAKNKAARK